MSRAVRRLAGVLPPQGCVIVVAMRLVATTACHSALTASGRPHNHAVPCCLSHPIRGLSCPVGRDLRADGTPRSRRPRASTSADFFDQTGIDAAQIGIRRCQQWCQEVPILVPYSSHRNGIRFHRSAFKRRSSIAGTARARVARNLRRVARYAPICTNLHRPAPTQMAQKEEYPRQGSNL
jgi:hypothetical protein